MCFILSAFQNHLCIFLAISSILKWPKNSITLAFMPTIFCSVHSFNVQRIDFFYQLNDVNGIDLKLKHQHCCICCPNNVLFWSTRIVLFCHLIYVYVSISLLHWMLISTDFRGMISTNMFMGNLFKKNEIVELVRNE